ncbi:hypothetical protein BDR03DRAFT_1008284 [Suillus americanus]|nr:hypothetical protein BDR03DRAFT_1008284 [Suillus americanus]
MTRTAEEYNELGNQRNLEPNLLVATRQLFSLVLSPLVPQTMGHHGKTKLGVAHRQHNATQRWLAKPGVRAMQNAKARDRMARKRASKKKVQSRADLDSNMPINPTALDGIDSRSLTPDVDESILTMGDDIACSCDIFTLQTIETLVRHWEKDWASEDLWNASYQEALTFAQAQGEQETTVFIDECEKHAWEGRMIIDNIRDVVHTNCLCCQIF